MECEAQKKRILFLADRNILIDQTMANDFRPFSGKMAKLSTKSKTIERDDGSQIDLTLALDRKRRIDTAYEVYLGLYQAITGPEERNKLFRGEEAGLSPNEVAFYDALADNESAVEVMGNEQLRVIAHELLEQLRRNITIDWQKKRASRAKMRMLVKRILKKFGYPPDLSNAAVKTVIEQAELWLKEAA